MEQVFPPIKPCETLTCDKYVRLKPRCQRCQQVHGDGVAEGKKLGRREALEEVTTKIRSEYPGEVSDRTDGGLAINVILDITRDLSEQDEGAGDGGS